MRHFSQNYNGQPHRGSVKKVKESQMSLGYIIYNVCTKCIILLDKFDLLVAADERARNYLN